MNKGFASPRIILIQAPYWWRQATGHRKLSENLLRKMEDGGLLTVFCLARPLGFRKTSRDITVQKPVEI